MPLAIIEGLHEIDTDWKVGVDSGEFRVKRYFIEIALHDGNQFARYIHQVQYCRPMRHIVYTLDIFDIEGVRDEMFVHSCIFETFLRQFTTRHTAELYNGAHQHIVEVLHFEAVRCGFEVWVSYPRVIRKEE